MNGLVLRVPTVDFYGCYIGRPTCTERCSQRSQLQSFVLGLSECTLTTFTVQTWCYVFSFSLVMRTVHATALSSVYDIT